MSRATADREPTAAHLLKRALRNNKGDPADDSESTNELACTMILRRPVVAIGASVKAYMPLMAEMLHTRLQIPPRSEVANAVGAAVGSVVIRQRVMITPTRESLLSITHR